MIRGIAFDLFDTLVDQNHERLAPIEIEEGRRIGATTPALNEAFNAAADASIPLVEFSDLLRSVDQELRVDTIDRGIEDALMLEQKVHEQLQALRTELKLARQTLDEARNRYANGLTDYLNVTSSLISVQNLESDEITQVANRYKARIALHKALGGNLGR